MVYDYVRSFNSVDFQDYLKKTNEFDLPTQCWGVYEVSGDKVNAILYVRLKPYKTFQSITRMQCNFQGTIKNKGTIIGFHMLPPYPRIMLLNEYELNYLKTPYNFYFKPFPIKENLKVENAWINVLKSKELLESKRYKKWVKKHQP
jgi:hypothetical protein